MAWVALGASTWNMNSSTRAEPHFSNKHVNGGGGNGDPEASTGKGNSTDF